MLQVLIRTNENYSPAEMAQMAIEAGAAWLVLDFEADAITRDTLADIAAICREAGVMLTIVNDMNTARELGLHGVFITDPEISPVKVRDELGPEAIIGAMAGTPDAAATLERADIDYVALDARLDAPEALIAALRGAGSEIAVVAYRPGMKLSPDDAAALLAQGFSGICGADRAFDTPDPVEAIKALLK